MRKEVHNTSIHYGELAMKNFDFFKLFDTKELFIFY